MCPNTTLHKAQITFWGIVFFVLGVFQVSILIIGLASVGVICWYRKQQGITMITLIVFGIVLIGMSWLGSWRYHSYEHRIEQQDLPFNQTIKFTGYVSMPPSVTTDAQKMYLVSAQLPVKVYLKLLPYPTYYYGEVVQVECKLIQPQPINGFLYNKYLARYGAGAICQQAHIWPTKQMAGNLIFRLIDQFRTQLQNRITTLWPNPVSSLVLAILLGIQVDFPNAIANHFRTTGVIHVLILSGVHVILLVQFIWHSTKKYVSFKITFGIILLGLILFNILSGCNGAVLRASSMAMLPLLARLAGRKKVAHYGLAIVAGLIGLSNPYILVYDTGFQLSFVATVGLIYFYPVCEDWFYWLPKLLGMRENAALTLAATIPMLPLSIQLFGEISLVSIPVNILIMPLTWLVLFGSMGSLIFTGLASVVQQLVQLMLIITQWFSQLPFAALKNVVLPSWISLLYYGVLVWIIIKKRVY